MLSMTIFVCALFFAFRDDLQKFAPGITTMMPAVVFPGSTWAANGASACQKLLTKADVLGAFLVHILPVRANLSKVERVAFTAVISVPPR